MAEVFIDDLIDSLARDDLPQQADTVTQLCRAWSAERIAPEILPYEERLLSDASMLLRNQIAVVEETHVDNVKVNFKMVIIQTELERIKYMLRSYLRTRILKIDRYALHCTRNPDIWSRLSLLERQYVQKHQAILERHYHISFMKDLPDSGNLRRLDDVAAAGLSMIEAPDPNKAVFVKVVQPIADRIPIESEALEVEIGNVFLTRYASVREYVQKVMSPLILQEHY